MSASRALSPRCWWTYKSGIECTSESGETTCPQTRAACAKRGVEHEFGGWEAFVDNKPAPIQKWAFAFQSVETPAGEHRLTLQFRPGSFRLGAVISLFTLAILLGIYAAPRIRASH